MNYYFVYILRCNDGSLYCGITTDVARRLRQHNGELKGGARYTRSRRPCRVVWKSLGVSKSFALRSEAQFKKFPKARKEDYVRPLPKWPEYD